MLDHAGAKWKFCPETFESWGPRKAAGKTGEFGGLPIIKRGNMQIDLTVPSLRALGMEFGYYPTNDWKNAAVIDMVTETANELFNIWSGAMIAQDKSNEEKAKIIGDSLAETGAAGKLMKVIETQLGKSGGRFITGNKVTIADCYMVSLIYNYARNPAGPMKDLMAPLIKQRFPRFDAYADELGKEFAKNLDSREAKPF